MCEWTKLKQTWPVLLPKFARSNKGANFFFSLSDEINPKYIQGPGKSQTLEYPQSKLPIITIRILQFSSIYFTKLYLWKRLFNTNSWLKPSRRIYEFSKQSPVLGSNVKHREKECWFCTWHKMRHILIKLWDTKSGCQIKRSGQFISN